MLINILSATGSLLKKGVNREKPRATMMVYSNEEAAMKYDRTKSKWFK